MRIVNFYYTESGECPVKEFLDSLSSKQAQKVIYTLQIIEELEIVPSQYLKKLTNTNDIWEVRVIFSGNIFRLLGFFENEQLIILNHAFQKKTQKTPAKDIKLAEKRKNNYLLRRQENE